MPSSQKNIANLIFAKKGVPDVKLTSSTDCGSFLSLDSTSNCSSLHLELKRS